MYRKKEHGSISDAHLYTDITNEIFLKQSTGQLVIAWKKGSVCVWEHVCVRVYYSVYWWIAKILHQWTQFVLSNARSLSHVALRKYICASFQFNKCMELVFTWWPVPCWLEGWMRRAGSRCVADWTIPTQVQKHQKRICFNMKIIIIIVK